MEKKYVVSAFVCLFLGMTLLLNVYASYCSEQQILGESCVLTPPTKYPLNITFPECAVDDNCAVYVLGDNRYIKNASVVISGAINVQGHTDNNGIFKFSPDKAGNIKITASKKGYYKAEGIFSIKKGRTSIDVPNNVEVNKEINIKIRNSKGKGIDTNIAIITPDKKTINTKTDKNGNAKFTPPTPGRYKIIIDNRNYQGEKEFIAFGRLNILCPDTVRFMDRFKVNVVDENNNTINAIIKILELNKEINNGDEVIAERCGNLNLVAEKEYYKKAKKTIFVENKKLNLTGKNKLNANETYLYTVKDEEGNAVKDAKIFLNDSFVGTTDNNGSITIKIEKPGNYIISAKKECYDEATLPIKVTEFSLMSLWWLWLLLLLLLILLLLFLWRRHKNKKIGKKETTQVMTPFGRITKSVKIVRKEGLDIPVASKQRVYVYLIAERDMKNCKIIDKIPTKFDVNVLTLGVERSENKLILNLGNINKGDVRILNYIVNGICELEDAKVVYEDKEFDIPTRYV